MKTLMTHLSSTHRHPQQNTQEPKIDAQWSPAKHSNSTTAQPNVCYANLMMESFRGPVHHHKRGSSSGLQTSSVTPVKTHLQNNNPLRLLTSPSQVPTSNGHNLKEESICRLRRDNDSTSTVSPQACCKKQDWVMRHRLRPQLNCSHSVITI